MSQPQEEQIHERTRRVISKEARVRRAYRHFPKGLDGKLLNLEMDSEDTFEEELILLSFHMSDMDRIDEILKSCDLYPDSKYFMEQLKEVISVAEHHQDEQKGGKMSFKAHFYRIPESLEAVNDTAIIVLAIHLLPKRHYRIAGYVHANLIECPQYTEPPRFIRGAYFNFMRINEHSENGVMVYRRKKIVSLIFSVLHHLTFTNDLQFTIAGVGKQNAAMRAACDRFANHFNEKSLYLHFKMYVKLNFFYGRRRYADQLVDITNEPELLRSYYDCLDAKFSRHLFYHLTSFEHFERFIRKLTSYSKTSRVYMMPDREGKMAAACVAMNWGEFFRFDIHNAKGVFRLMQSSGIMKQLLRPLLVWGEPNAVERLLKGLSSLYRREHGVQVMVLTTYDGGPYQRIYKSVFADELTYFICAYTEETRLPEYMEYCSDSRGITQIFLDQPIT